MKCSADTIRACSSEEDACLIKSNGWRSVIGLKLEGWDHRTSDHRFQSSVQTFWNADWCFGTLVDMSATFCLLL